MILAKAGKSIMVFAGGVGAWYYKKQWDDAADALHIDRTNKKEIIKIFKAIDTDHSGAIDKNELKLALKKANKNVSDFQLNQLMKADTHHSGDLSEEEFLNAIMHIDFHAQSDAAHQAADNVDDAHKNLPKIAVKKPTK